MRPVPAAGSIRVKVRGSRFQCFIDGQRQFNEDDSRFTRGRIGLWANKATGKFRNIKVTSRAGKILWNGLPDLPAAI